MVDHQKKAMISPFLLMAIFASFPTSSNQEEQNISLVQKCISKELVDPWEIKVRGREFIHLALVLSGNRVDIDRHVGMADRLLSWRCW